MSEEVPNLPPQLVTWCSLRLQTLALRTESPGTGLPVLRLLRNQDRAAWDLAFV